MPTFDFTAPDGKSYSVNGPEGATPEQAFQILQQQIGTVAPKEGGSSVGGVAKSLGTGLAEGAIGLAGLPGDLYHLGLRALGDKLTPESNYGSGAIKKGVEGVTGEFYKPQGVAEETASKIGMFAPAVLGGPGSMAARLATRAVVPAVASEAAGLLAGDTAAKPYAELAGALAGGVGGAVAAQKFGGLAKARSVAPSAEETIKTAKGQFKAAEDMNLTVTPDFASSAAAKIRSDLKGFDPEAQAVVFKAADRLESLGKPTAAAPYIPVEMNEVELIRKQLTTLKTSPDASVREAARKAITSLQESQTALNPAQVLRGDADLYSQTMRDAIGNYAAGKRSNTVMGKVALGDLNAATAGSGANEDNALRQAIKQLVRPVNNDIVPKASRLGFNQDEIGAMNTVARGTPTGNAARYIGKLAPTGSVSGVLSGGAGFAAAGPAGAVALPAVGYLAKKIGDMSTKRAVAALDEMVRLRSPLAAKIAGQLPPQVVQRLSPTSKAKLTAMLMGNSVIAPQNQAVAQPRN